MKKIYAIGLHKTGSTSLQWFLLVNQWRLAQTGVLYPPTTPRGLARMMAVGVGQMSADAASDVNDVMGHNALAYRLIAEETPDFGFPAVHDPMFSGDMALEIIDQAALLTKTKTLVLCSEDLARLALVAPQGLSRLKNRFGAEDSELHCTIRRPDEAIEAWQNQTLKGGHSVPRLTQAGIESYLRSVHVAYPQILENWQDRIPGIALNVHPYSEIRTGGGSVDHFIRASGIAWPNGIPRTQDRNIGLHPALFEIARLANDKLPRRETYFLRDWLSNVQSALNLPDKSHIELLGQINRNRLSQAFAPSHRRLSDLCGRELFFHDIDNMTTLKPIPAITAARAALGHISQLAKAHLPDSPRRDFLINLDQMGIPDD